MSCRAGLNAKTLLTFNSCVTENNILRRCKGLGKNINKISSYQIFNKIWSNHLILTLCFQTKCGGHLKVCLTQRGMLPLKDDNIIVYSDGVSHKL